MLKKSKKSSSQGHFSEFVDENSPEQAAQVQRSWRKKAKQQKNKLFTRILIIATIVVAIIFAVTLKLVINNDKPAHSILDQDQDGYTVVQSIFPHLKVLVSNQAQTYQTRMVKGIGIVFGDVVSWIGANIVSNQRILYVPNQKAGTNLLGMALAYNLQTSLGGKLDVLVLTEPYKQLTLKNVQIMNNFKDEKVSLNLIDNVSIDSKYDLLLVQNNEFLNSAQLERYSKILQIKKAKWDSLTIANYFSQYTKYQIVKGRSNSQSLLLGQFNGYALVPLKESTKEEYKQTLILKQSNIYLNLCPENIQYFKEASQKRNLLEYMRNKTLNTNQFVFYCLTDTHTLKGIAGLSNINNNYIIGKDAEDAIISEKWPYTSSNHIYVMQLLSYSKFSEKLKGEILLYVKTQKQASEITSILSSTPFKILSPFNNNGCLYPVPLYPYKELKPFHPFFIQANLL